MSDFDGIDVRPSDLMPSANNGHYAGYTAQDADAGVRKMDDQVKRNATMATQYKQFQGIQTVANPKSSMGSRGKALGDLVGPAVKKFMGGDNEGA